MVAMIKVMAAALMAILPGGLLVMAAYVLARLVAEKLKTVEQGPDRYKKVLAGLKFRDVWDEARRSL